MTHHTEDTKKTKCGKPAAGIDYEVGTWQAVTCPDCLEAGFKEAWNDASEMDMYREAAGIDAGVFYFIQLDRRFETMKDIVARQRECGYLKERVP